jgi:hypothetical protein
MDLDDGCHLDGHIADLVRRHARRRIVLDVHILQSDVGGPRGRLW